MKNILITGVNGYIGRHLAEAISNQVDAIHGSVREIKLTPHNLKMKLFQTGDLCQPIDWSKALAQVDTVFHVAGTVHTNDRPEVYNKAIIHGTKNLVEQAIKQGVKHFVYISSAAVYGKENHSHIIRETDTPTPNTPYGEAKFAAENELIRLTKNSNMTYTIVRPPIVIGKNAPGNVARLKKLTEIIRVLPLGSATAKRSMVSINNLVDFLILCGTNENARNQIFNITDADMSTNELCQLFAKESNKHILLLPIPKSVMRLSLCTLGQQSLYEKLFGQLQLSTDHAKGRLNWRPSDNRLNY